MSLRTSFIATGDSFMTRRLPEGTYDGFQELKELIESNDVRFNNLEITIHRQEGYPAAFSGGTWAMADPEVLDDLNRFGFNLYNTANNHSLDYRHGGLLATIQNLKKIGRVFAGTGKNLADASSAAYVETPNARVAMIAACSSFHDSDIAGNQSAALPGRPGLNPLRFKSVYSVTKDYFGMLREVSEKTDMNAGQLLEIANGYALPLPSELLYFGGMHFQLGTENAHHTMPLQKDMDRILESVREAKRQADYVLVSIHSHEFAGRSLVNPAEFLRTFTHACIDAGADMVLGHGPHILRGIEIYKGRVIFFSLGNFIYQTETVALQPAEAYENAGLPPETMVGEYMLHRSLNGTRGHVVQKEIWRSVVAQIYAENGLITEVLLHPVSLGMDLPRSRRGVPKLSHDNDTLIHLAELSEPFGTKIEIQNGVGRIRLS